MANISYKTHFLTLVGALLLATLAIGPESILGQNCGCAPNYCCSKFGYCGNGDPYCGQGCQSGPCYGSPSTGGGGGGGGGVAGIVSDAFFNGIANQAGGNCEGKGFYTRAAFLNAAGAYPQFGTTGSSDDQKREIAAAFAHFTHETGHFCYINEINGAANSYCQSNPQYPCAAGKSYHGRGPIQISWNYNYIPAGSALGFDGLNDPDAVGRDSTISFKTGLWFWMNNCHSIVGQGFGATIRKVNGIECNGGNPAAVNARVGYYNAYCSQLGVNPGSNLSC